MVNKKFLIKKKKILEEDVLGHYEVFVYPEGKKDKMRQVGGAYAQLKDSHYVLYGYTGEEFNKCNALLGIKDFPNGEKDVSKKLIRYCKFTGQVFISEKRKEDVLSQIRKEFGYFFGYLPAKAWIEGIFK